MPLGHKELQTLQGKSKNKMREMWRGEGDMEMGKERGEGRGERERWRLSGERKEKIRWRLMRN